MFFVESNGLNQGKGANCYVILFSLYKNSPSKYQTIYENSIVKNMLSEKFWVPEKFIYKEKTVKKEESKKRYHKINYKSLSSISIVYMIAVFWNFGIGTALLLWR